MAGQHPVQVQHLPSGTLAPAGPRAAHRDPEGLGARTRTAMARYTYPCLPSRKVVLISLFPVSVLALN